MPGPPSSRICEFTPLEPLAAGETSFFDGPFPPPRKDWAPTFSPRAAEIPLGPLGGATKFCSQTTALPEKIGKNLSVT